MTEPSKLTAVEWEIMESVWALGDSPSVRDVLERAYPKGEKAYTTVQTIMNTLERKGFLRRHKKGLVNFYTPAKTRGQVVRTETRRLISRVFDGSVPALANHLIESGKLSLEDIEAIKGLLERKVKELRSKKP
jgi:predicted transcriptional regulator